MTNFRISIGSGSCKGHNPRSAIEKQACEKILFKEEYLKTLSFAQLSLFSPIENEEFEADGKNIFLTVFKEEIDDGLLIVIQVFVPTLYFPTYFSFSGIGKIFAEGFVINSADERSDASDLLLGAYR